NAELALPIDNARSVAHQSASFDILALIVHGRHRVASGTYAPHQKASLFDHPAGAQEDGRRDDEMRTKTGRATNGTKSNAASAEICLRLHRPTWPATFLLPTSRIQTGAAPRTAVVARIHGGASGRAQ